ncbi:hypothetical protein LINPERPRIM_LOCUS16471, partial [Linum perenne]
YGCLKNVRRRVTTGVQRRRIRNPVCSSATSAVRNVCVFLLERTGTKKSVLATTTGKPRKAALNVLRLDLHYS